MLDLQDRLDLIASRIDTLESGLEESREEWSQTSYDVGLLSDRVNHLAKPAEAKPYGRGTLSR